MSIHGFGLEIARGSTRISDALRDLGVDTKSLTGTEITALGGIIALGEEHVTGLTQVFTKVHAAGRAAAWADIQEAHS